MPLAQRACQEEFSTQVVIVAVPLVGMGWVYNVVSPDPHVMDAMLYMLRNMVQPTCYMGGLQVLLSVDV